MCKLTAGAFIKTTIPTVFGLLFVSAWLPGNATADIYRWVDERGVVNYTQQKPNNVPSVLVGKATTAVTTRSTSQASQPSSESAQPALSEAQQRKLDELKEEGQEREAELAMRQEENCNRAQSVLEQLMTNNRIRIRGDDGTVRAIGEEERQARISETQLSIAENCTS